MVKIKFLVDAAPRNNSGDRFEAGQEVEMPVPSAEHWVKRKKAFYIGDSAPSSPKVFSEPPVTEPIEPEVIAAENNKASDRQSKKSKR